MIKIAMEIHATASRIESSIPASQIEFMNQFLIIDNRQITDILSDPNILDGLKTTYDTIKKTTLKRMDDLIAQGIISEPKINTLTELKPAQSNLLYKIQKFAETFGYCKMMFPDGLGDVTYPPETQLKPKPNHEPSKIRIKLSMTNNEASELVLWKNSSSNGIRIQVTQKDGALIEYIIEKEKNQTQVQMRYQSANNDEVVLTTNLTNQFIIQRLKHNKQSGIHLLETNHSNGFAGIKGQPTHFGQPFSYSPIKMIETITKQFEHATNQVSNFLNE
jgi:hypothetical protein